MNSHDNNTDSSNLNCFNPNEDFFSGLRSILGSLTSNSSDLSSKDFDTQEYQNINIGNDFSENQMLINSILFSCSIMENSKDKYISGYSTSIKSLADAMRKHLINIELQIDRRKIEELD